MTQKKVQRYYSIPLSLTNRIPFEATEDDWEKITAKNPRGKYRDFKYQIDEVTRQAEDIINKMPEFSFEKFKELFKGGQNAVENTLYAQFENYISELREEKRVSTADSYQCALNSFKKFDPKADFGSIDKTGSMYMRRGSCSKPKEKAG